jgi:Holliday junction resolvase RusA-like endonuclease
MITFTAPGDPVAQPRPQISTRGGFGRAFVRRVHPIHAYRDVVQLVAKAAMDGQAPIAGPVSLRVWLYIARPKSHSKARRADPNHTQKPDGSNVLKGLEDALNGICWIDDSQIVDTRISKRWTELDAKTIVIIDPNPVWIDPYEKNFPRFFE